MQRVRETSFDHILIIIIHLGCRANHVWSLAYFRRRLALMTTHLAFFLRTTTNTPPLFQTDANASMSEISPGHPFALFSPSLLTCLAFLRGRKDHLRSIQAVKFVRGAPSERKD